jgi:hypothetical protein
MLLRNQDNAARFRGSAMKRAFDPGVFSKIALAAAQPVARAL